MKVYFPFEKVRAEQQELVKDVAEVASKGKILLAQAPTGLGKTVSTLAPFLCYALENNKKVFFLTPKISQHEMVLETAKLMNEKFELGVRAVDLVGKKQMCVEPFISNVSAGFYEACRKAKKEKKCKYYCNTKGSTPKQKQEAMRNKRPLLDEYNRDFAYIKEQCAYRELCPYELTVEMIKRANLVIADYSHLFDPSIRENLLGQGEVELDDIMVIVDEAHNLPERIRDMMTASLSVEQIEKAQKEAKSIAAVEVELILKDIEKEILGLGKKLGIDRQEARLGGTDLNFLRKISVQSMLAMEEAAEKFMVKFKTENSFLLGLTEFLGELIREKEHTLYLIERKNSLNITAIPLEVDEIAGEVLHKVHAGVIMSGTLLPLEMYADVLGVNNGKEKVKEIKEGTVGMEEQTEDAKTLLQHNKEKENFLKENNFDPKRNLPNSFSRVLMKEYKSPFPKNNRLNLFVDKTTTKYTSRSQEQYAEIAGVVDKVVSQVPGNTIVFFPSFELMENISTLLRTSRQKLKQEREMNQQAKTKLVNDFKLLGSRFGGVLLAVSGGSIAEGLDFPGEHLSCAIIAGIPYAKMNLYSNALIEYNEKKFRRGWDYGYNAPAINKALQAAGRVIRTETDTGVCVFLDQRFSEEKYRKFFPKDFEAKKTIEPEKEIEKFFS